MYLIRFLFIFLVSSLFMAAPALAQKKTKPKYPSLFWEITGNGLKKPSYLFGTMHVSSKMAFHLSDSFYIAIKNVDAVALELNPDHWQPEMVSLNQLRDNYTAFTTEQGKDLLTENDFRITDYINELKIALSSEPAVVNNLLYRTYKQQEDFEEDTFLDLYIFQTGRKLGKRASGVENFYETEKLIMQAYVDMAKEKKKSRDGDADSRYNINEKLQDAYRQGNLDLLDSLDLLTESSMAFREKFIYARNVIQANSIDTILKTSSLFAGVGASHLPGERGVIELLRKKGYRLRPIFMTDKDAAQKEEIDKLKVPVQFSRQVADDSAYSVAMPGPLFKMEDEYQLLDRRQYADMHNGTYYIVTRVSAHGPFLGLGEKDHLKKVDSLLYENIPGKIISKKAVTVNGHPGFDISNRTRRGDLQRNLIVVTDYEIFLFKMSGKENYVNGPEAEQFFSSIRINDPQGTGEAFNATGGAFSIRFPQAPHVAYDKGGYLARNRWEYEAKDSRTGDAYLVLKKTVNNFGFIEEDTFDLSLIEESFRDPEKFSSQEMRKTTVYERYPCLEVKEKQKDGTYVLARYLVRGPHYYVVAVKTKNGTGDFSSYFNSFHFTGWQYPSFTSYEDTFMRFKVISPVTPLIPNDMRKAIEDAAQSMQQANTPSYSAYWPKATVASFRSDTTGELVSVFIREYPKYYYSDDSARFWKAEADNLADKEDMILFSREEIAAGKGLRAFHVILRDTNSSRTIEKLLLLSNQFSCTLQAMGDTVSGHSSFISRFFDSFLPLERREARNIFDDRLTVFFDDLFSKDSALHAGARQVIPSVYFGEKGIPKILNAINRLSISDKDYFEIKARLIAELGYIKDTTRPQVVEALRRIYDQTADTSLFRNEVFQALARHHTRDAYALLKELLIQDPPVFEDSYEYSGLFESIGDSVLLARELFPDVLQLLTLEDYKEPVLTLLVNMVDSGVLKAADYESYFTKLYFDAKVELKKQQAKDEKLMEKENKKEDENETDSYDDYSYGDAALDNYCVLLMPFYDKNSSVQKYFEKLLLSRDPSVRLNAAVLLLRNHKPVADSVLTKLAGDDRYSASLFTRLEKISQAGLFPAAYRNQQHLARGILLADKGLDKVDSVFFLSRQKAGYGNKRGFVYFYKYRVKKEDDWKIGISGLQPLNEKEVSSDDKLTSMTDKKIRADEPLEVQLQQQLKKMLFALHHSAANFYSGGDYLNSILQYMRR
ncbi:MAG: TraB/GumN family protein [Ferruginibacter sp.]